MSNRSTRAGQAGRPLSRPAPAADADAADHALANIRAWTQLLVARGNRLLELAVRERNDSARDAGAMRIEVRDAAPPAAKAGRRAERASRKSAATQHKPRA